MSGKEIDYVQEAFDTNWVAPVGPHVDGFERDFAARLGIRHALALSSGTAALHLALRVLRLTPGDEVLCSTLTFAASAYPIVYEGARPVFIRQPGAFVGHDDVRVQLESRNIETRPTWKPMHRQPVFAGCRVIGGEVADAIFDEGLCLPSGSNLTVDDLARVDAVRSVPRRLLRRAQAVASAGV